MSRVIYKKEIHIGTNNLLLPPRASIIHFGLDPKSDLCIWYSLGVGDDTKADDQVHRILQIVGTGNPYPSDYMYIGTCKTGVFVWHLFEVPQ